MSSRTIQSPSLLMTASRWTTTAWPELSRTLRRPWLSFSVSSRYGLFIGLVYLGRIPELLHEAPSRDLPPALRGFELAVEPREDGLHEGVRDQADDGLPDAGVRVFDRAGNVDDGGDLVARLVLQHVGEPADDFFVDFFQDRLLLVLLRIVDVDVLDQRLHVADDLLVLDLDLGVDGEGPLDHVQLAIGAQEVVHRGERSALDRDVEVEVGTAARLAEGGVRAGRAAPHELPGEPGLGRSLPEPAREVRHREIGPADVDAVGVVGIPVDQGEVAVGHMDAVEPDKHLRLVVLGHAGSRGGAVFFGGGGGRGMDVVEAEVVDVQVGDVRLPVLRAVLDLPLRGEDAAVDVEVGARAQHVEALQRHAGELIEDMHARVGLREEVRMALYDGAAGPEQDAFGAHGRGIEDLVVPGGPDVLGDQIDPGELQRPLRVLVHIDELPVPHLDLVELQRIDGLEGFLPAPVLDADRVAVFLLELLQVDVDARPVDDDVGHQTEMEDLLPLDARLHLNDA